MDTAGNGGCPEKAALACIYTSVGKVGSQWEAAVRHREPSLALCGMREVEGG